MRTGSAFRRFALFLLSLAALILVALLAAPLFVPAELYRDKVELTLEDATGRDIDIRGDIGLRFLPRLQLNLGDVRMGNPQNFGASGQDMLTLKELQLSLGFFDLLQGNVNIDTLRLVDPVIYLARNASGKPNWAFDTAKSATKPLAEQDAAPSNHKAAVSMPAMDIINGTVLYKASPQAQQISLNQFNARIKLPAMNQRLSIQADTLWNGNLPVKAKLHFDSLAAWMNGKETDYDIELLAGGDLLKFTANGKANPINDTGKASPHVKGEMQLAVASLKKLSIALGSPLLQQAQGETKIKLRSMFNYQNDNAKLLGTTLSVDDTAISGSGSLNLAGARPMVIADLSTESVLVLDSLLAKEKGSIRRNTPSEDTATAESSAWSKEPVIADSSVLKIMDARLKFRIGGIKAEKISAGAMDIAVTLSNGNLNLDVPSFAFYDGTATAKASLRTQDGNRLRISKNASLSNANIGQFLSDAYGFDRLAGRGNLTLAFAADGASTHDFVHSVDGNGAFALQNGAIKGFNLADVVRDARNLVQTVQNKAITAEMQGTAQAAQTDFSSLNASFSIADGLVKNSDLALKAPLLDVTGGGTVNLPAKTVDYRLRPTLVGSIEGENRTQQTSGGVTIPVKVTGNFDQLKFAPDASGAVQELVKDPKAAIKGVEDNVRGLRDDMKSLFKGL